MRSLRRFGTAWHNAFFGRISAVPFGLMRITWAIAAFFSVAWQWPRLTLLYSDQGVFPPEFVVNYSRSYYRFTILTYVHDPVAVHLLFLLLILALLCMAVGYRSRLSTLLSVILLFSFQEHTYAVYAGGDTVLRVIGFILAIAPGIGAVSLDRLFEQEHAWLTKGITLPALTMPKWPRLMFTWQMVCLYVTAGWYKTLDHAWRSGTGVVASMEHAEFTRFGPQVGAIFGYFSVPLSWGTMAWQISWLVFLVPWAIRRRLPKRLQGYRRWMLTIGFTFHLLILIFMDAGIFSLSMLATYVAILDEHDYAALAKWINWKSGWQGKIAVLYDGQCSFCRRTVLPLVLGDWLQRATFVDFHDAAAKKEVAADISLAALDRALHVRFPSGRTFAGFDAIRALAWHIPWTLPFAPFLYLPGVAPLGRAVYEKVSDRRHCLIGGDCRVKA